MSECTAKDCKDYPYYGVAPHECYWRKPGGFEENPLGTSTILDLEHWPENFAAELDDPSDMEKQLSWGLCGVYYCPSCGSGVNMDGLYNKARISELLQAQHTPEGRG